MLSPEIKKRIEELGQQGVLIIDKPYKEHTLPDLPPDAILPKGVAYIHRQFDSFNIYFISNQNDRNLSFSAKFRHTDKVVTVYRPESNRYTWTDGYKDSLTLELAPHESVFVVFGYRQNCIGTSLVKESFGHLLRLEYFHSKDDTPDVSKETNDPLFVGYRKSDYSHAGNKTFPRWEQNIPTLGINSQPEAHFSVELTYQQAIAYLRHEALTLPDDTPRGLVTVCFQDFPLGLVKNIGTRANNLYPKEWKIKTTYVPQEYVPILHSIS
jgi:hypothetical protein